MALQHFINGAWTSYTAGDPLNTAPILRFRDTALSVSGGAATLGQITLKQPAAWALVQVIEGDDTLTAGTGVVRPLSVGITYAAGRKPTFANDDTSGISFTITDSANECGSVVGGVPESFDVYFSGITGDAATLHVEVEVHCL